MNHEDMNQEEMNQEESHLIRGIIYALMFEGLALIVAIGLFRIINFIWL